VKYIATTVSVEKYIAQKNKTFCMLCLVRLTSLHNGSAISD